MGYEWLKALHIAAVIAWLAGLFYLPRLFVYHAEAPALSDRSETFKLMERRLYRIIMNPAMAVTWLAGLALAALGNWWLAPWFLAKAVLVGLLTLLHVWLGLRIREFAEDRNRFGSRTFRMVNEVPTLLMLVIVVLAVVKPF